MFIADPVAAVSSLGPSLGAVVVCTGLFVWSQIQFTLVARDLKQHMAEDEKNFADLKNLSVGGLNQQNQLSLAVSKMADAVKENGTSIGKIADNQVEQLNLLKKMVADNRVLMVNQENVQAQQLRLLEQLVNKLVA